MRYSLAMVLFFAAAMLETPARAQSTNYSIPWHTIAGGGGTSSGGNFTVSGTIGQHSTAAMSGGAFSLTGGFWSIIAAIQTPGSPLLTVAVAGKQATISWPAPATGTFALEQSANVAAGGWKLSTATLSTNSGVISAIVTVGSGNQFFRLQSQ